MEDTNSVVPLLIPAMEDCKINAEQHPYYELNKILHDDSQHVTIFAGTWRGPECSLVSCAQPVIVKRCRCIHDANGEVDILYKLMHKTNPFQDFFMKLIYVRSVKNVKGEIEMLDLVLQHGGMDLYNHFQLFYSVDNELTLTLRIKRLSRILSKVVTCVVKLHALRLVHKDIKPENVVVDNEDRVALIDFGIATAANSAPAVFHNDGEKIGSRFFMHPHLLWDLPLSLYHNDLWAIGQTALQLFTERCLYDPAEATLEQQFAVLRLFLTNERWFEVYAMDKMLRQHASFTDFCRFVTRMCCETKRPCCADMMLLQEPFLCYWRSGV